MHGHFVTLQRTLKNQKKTKRSKNSKFYFISEKFLAFSQVLKCLFKTVNGFQNSSSESRKNMGGLMSLISLIIEKTIRTLNSIVQNSSGRLKVMKTETYLKFGYEK